MSCGMIFRHGCVMFRGHYKAKTFLPNLISLPRHCSNLRNVNLSGAKASYNFDTLRLSKHLENSGLTKEQAEVVTYALVEITQGQMDFIHKNLTTKEQQEILLQQLLSQISMIRKDMLILEKSEFSNLKHDYEKQNFEIGQIKTGFKEELSKMKADVALDLNLEKSRSKDAHVDSEKSISRLEHKIGIMASEHDKQITGLDNKIQTEIAKLLATYERYRNDIIKFAGGAVLSCLTICLGFYRMWK